MYNEESLLLRKDRDDPPSRERGDDEVMRQIWEFLKPARSAWHLRVRMRRSHTDRCFQADTTGFIAGFSLAIWGFGVKRGGWGGVVWGVNGH